MSKFKICMPYTSTATLLKKETNVPATGFKICHFQMKELLVNLIPFYWLFRKSLKIELFILVLSYLYPRP